MWQLDLTVCNTQWPGSHFWLAGLLFRLCVPVIIPLLAEDSCNRTQRAIQMDDEREKLLFSFFPRARFAKVKGQQHIKSKENATSQEREEAWSIKTVGNTHKATTVKNQRERSLTYSRYEILVYQYACLKRLSKIKVDIVVNWQIYSNTFSFLSTISDWGVG